MKTKWYSIFAVCLVVAYSCKKKAHPIGGGAYPVCNCKTGTFDTTYNLASTYKPADSLIYKDSCQHLKTYYHQDSCFVFIIAL